VQLLVNGKMVATDNDAAYSFTLNTKKYDKAGNATTTAARTWHR
jgi:Big-like domain-containing protein